MNMHSPTSVDEHVFNLDIDQNINVLNVVSELY
jgi:hypothetical protein